METSRLIIRIVFDVGHEVDWHVASPQDITFRDVLDVITEVKALNVNELLIVWAFLLFMPFDCMASWVSKILAKYYIQ